jgi:regulator of cell morphogenesis and NO signaling
MLERSTGWPAFPPGRDPLPRVPSPGAGARGADTIESGKEEAIMNATLQATVGQLVTERPARARVFESFGIDYCCGGKKPLSQACGERGLDARMVLGVLAAFDQQPAPGERDWSKAGLAELADHVEATHHAYLKQELPRLAFLTARVATRHGDRRPELVEIHEIFLRFQAELESHMAKEERVLFPLCRALDAAAAGAQPSHAQPSQAQLPASHCASVKTPIAVMVREHEDAGEALARFRELTDDFTPPADACNTWHAMYDALQQLERDMHEHVHQENNILFPRAIQAERQRAAAAAAAGEPVANRREAF